MMHFRTTGSRTNGCAYASRNTHGYLVVLTLIFGSIFFVMLTAFMGFVITQKQTQDDKRNAERALAIAEAGLNYYKWYLAHNPDDLTNGTGNPGPYVISYSDPEADVIGEYELAITGNSACGEITSIDIESTGRTSEDPSIERSISARYAQPTVAEYAYIINSNVWAGDDRTIVGPYHSNGVIRMDGTNNSVVTSGQENWTCDEDELPCDPHNDGDTVDGVYGDGPGSDLWVFPAPPISFAGISVDLATMQDKAANAGGIYLGPSGQYGYKIEFKADGTIDVYRVRRKENEPRGNAWGYQLNKIKNAQFVANYDIPEACPLVYVEDQVWLEGTVNGKATVAAADIDTNGVEPSIILQDNITYVNEDSGLLAVAEYDVLVGFDVPNDMELNGIFIAQNGRFGRNHYDEDDLPSAWDQYVKRNSLTINGSIVSNGRVGTKWVYSNGTWASGFETRYNAYDRDLVADPPPLTPITSQTYQFIEWRENE